MAKRRNRLDLSCVPVDPIDLFRRLSDALGLESRSSVSPEDVVTRSFPDVGAEQFRDLYLLREVLRKYPEFDLGVDTRQAAVSTFLEDEQLNAETNNRLLTYNAESPRVGQVLDLAARKAVRVLGVFRWDWLVEGARFGPGATTRLSRESASVAGKLSGVPHVNLSAYNLARTYLSLHPGWERSSQEAAAEMQLPCLGGGDAMSPSLCCYESGMAPLAINELDKFDTVPKSAVTDRTIGIPPDMNILLQLGVGYHMRKRMYTWGINLNDQSINQCRALEGSVDGKLATIDLKSASNSVTQGLVWKMIGNHSHDWTGFDPTWYAVLDALRTSGCRIDGKPHEYELFSAMGNGFTFELESLLFWALAMASCETLGVEPDVTVYGDDLIVPVESVDLLREVLDWCGFRLNGAKSFWNTSGPLFRESCGAHYLDGRDVTPFYVDDGLKRTDQIILLANNIVRWSRRDDGSLDGRMQPVWLWVVGHLSDDCLKCAIPYGEANDGLIMDFDQALPSTAYLGNPEIPGMPRPPRAELRIGYRVKTITLKTRTRIVDGQDGLMVWFYEAEKRRFQVPSLDSLQLALSKVPIVAFPGLGEAGESGYVPAKPRRNPGRLRISEQVREPVKGLKRSLEAGTRVVKAWPRVGPWVHNDDVTLPSVVDVLLSKSL